MIQKIYEQISNVNESIAWLRKNMPAVYDQRFISLVAVRRELRLLANAERHNPSIAAYGQSQVGKSYLMNCILQSNTQPFLVAAEDEHYNFVDEINPIGEGKESTGVVTRFTSYSRNEEDYNVSFPIRMRVLSLKDFINILSDTYYNEFDDCTPLGDDESNAYCAELRERYGLRDRIGNPILTADDMLDCKEYFTKHINNAQVYSKRTPFFDTLALLIDRIPIEDYSEIFSHLWKYEGDDTRYRHLFDKAIDILRRLHFAEYIYLPISAVLHGGKKEDTIMSVSCLKLLDTDEEKKYRTDVYTCANSEVSSLGNFTKSELCMVCAEVIIRIDDEYLTKKGTFDMSMCDPLSKEKIPEGEVSVNVLRSTDLIDFPGARARGNMLLEQNSVHENLMFSLLRGKVAYLFNKYNEEKNINILLFCHHHRNLEAPQMWQLLDSWVKEYVGKTPEERKRYIDMLGLSPLFHIGTMWNLNLQHPDNMTVGMTDESILSRWHERFKELLIGECFKEADWVSNWDGENKHFQNCYMLRDFNFSQTVYSGWKDNGTEGEMLIEEDYYKRMRELFISSNKDYDLFEDAAVAWDVSSTKNNDGALYILYKLAQVSEKISVARTKKIESELTSCINRVYEIMESYHHNEDSAKRLEMNMSKARSIFREMDFTCSKDNYFFGHLLQTLQMTEKECYTIVHNLIQGTALNEAVNEFKEYEIIHQRCKDVGRPIEVEETDDARWQCIIDTYNFKDRSEAELYLEQKGVDAAKLFAPKYRRRVNSCIIADKVLSQWCEKVKSVEMLNTLVEPEGFEAKAMADLIDGYCDAAQALCLTDIMSAAIKQYVDVTDVHTANAALLADTLATIINDFVLDFGYKYIPAEKRDAAKDIYAEWRVPSFTHIDIPSDNTIIDETALTELFTQMSTNPDALLPSFNNTQKQWLEYMFVAFGAHDVVPKYNIAANNELKELLDRIDIDRQQ